jgi:hypothetical protein
VRARGLGPQPFGVVPSGDQEHGSGVGTNPVKGEPPRGAGSDQREDQLLQALELAVEELRAPPEFP